MDGNQTEYFKRILNMQLEYLIHQADQVVSELVSQSGQEIEYLDRASASADQALKLKIRTRESRLIRKVRLALERIEEGTYGYCDECGEEIAIRRLEARPVTTKCLECKESEEMAESFIRQAAGAF